MKQESKALAWKVHGTRRIYADRWLVLELADVEPPNGTRFEHDVIRMDAAAIALIVDNDDRALTLWRHRFATNDWGYELIGGLVEEGEDPARAAAREAEEESGWRPVGEPEHLITFQPMPGMIDSPVHVYLWRKAIKIGEPTDAEEAARIEWIPIEKMLPLVRRGSVLGAGAIVALLLYALSRQSGMVAPEE
jgi:8-oxo-dGTP pyrophosphatase MutT (NUDIX family)